MDKSACQAVHDGACDSTRGRKIDDSTVESMYLTPQDFEPWIDSEDARRSGKSIAETAIDTAKTWKDGLAKWGIDSSRLRALKNAAQDIGRANARKILVGIAVAAIGIGVILGDPGRKGDR